MRTRDYSALACLRDAPDETLLAPSDAARITGFSTLTLKRWGREGKGPHRISVEGWPRYRLGDVRTWINAAA